MEPYDKTDPASCGMTAAQTLEGIRGGAQWLRENYGMTAEEYVREEMFNDVARVVNLYRKAKA